MKENLVQWTLLQNLDFLSKSLDFQIAIKKVRKSLLTMEELILFLKIVKKIN